MKLLDMAARLALGCDKRKNYRLAAVCVRRDGAITFSRNELTQTPQPRCHAESRVLQKSDNGCTLYVARVHADGCWAQSKPCSRCQAIIRNMGVSKVVYTIGPGEYGTWYPQKDKRP